MKKLLICTLLASAFSLVAAELKFPCFQMSEGELIAVLRENGLNDKVTAAQELSHKGSAACVPLLAVYLTDAADKALFHAARYALQNIPCPEAEAALKKALREVKDPKRHTGLVDTLKTRAQPVPDGYAGAAETICAFPPKNAVQRGDLATIPGLVDQALGTGFPAQFARRSLIGFPNEGVVPAMLALAKGSDVKKARLAISVLGDRRVRSCLPQFVALARNPQTESAIRNEAFKAIAAVGNPKDLPLLLDLLKSQPTEDRLVGAIIRLANRAFATQSAKIDILKAEYGYYPEKKVVDVTQMISELVSSGATSVMAANRLAGKGGMAVDPAPGKVKELRMTFKLNGGAPQSTVTTENDMYEFVGTALDAQAAKLLVDGAKSATGDLRAAYVKILSQLVKHGDVPGADAILFQPLFNGKDLTGWSQQDGFFSVQDGVITGDSTKAHPCRPNHHLIYTAETFADFDLRLEFKLSRSANSGVQLRCLPQFVGDNGYQADMNGGGDFVGYLYHPKQHLVGERGADVSLNAQGAKQVRRFADNKALQAHYKIEQWNDMRVVASGRTLTVWINGMRTTSITDMRTSFLPERGHIGFQLHAGPEMKVQYRNVRIKK